MKARSRLEEISEREQQLQTALTAGRLGSWSLNVQAMMFKASPSSRRHLGVMTDGEFLMSNCSGSCTPRMWSVGLKRLQNTLDTGADYVIEYRNIRPDGSVQWVDVRALGDQESVRQDVSLVGVSLDITSRKNSDLERERLLAELARSERPCPR